MPGKSAQSFGDENSVDSFTLPSKIKPLDDTEDADASTASTVWRGRGRNMSFCAKNSFSDHQVVRLRNDFSTRIMRTQEPDDELGGMLFLALPTTVVHHIDPWSPLVPDYDDLTNGGA